MRDTGSQCRRFPWRGQWVGSYGRALPQDWQSNSAAKAFVGQAQDLQTPAATITSCSQVRVNVNKRKSVITLVF